MTKKNKSGKSSKKARFPRIGKPFANVHFYFWVSRVPLSGFELEWCLVAASLEGFPRTGHEKKVPRAPFKGIKRVQGAPPGTKNTDAAFLLTIGSFLLTVEFFYLQLTILALFLLTVGASLLTILVSLLTVGVFCLQWESASNTGLKGL